MLARRRDASVPPPLWNVRNVLPATIIDDLDHAAVRRELKSGHIGTGARRLEVKDDLHAYGANHIERRAATLHQTAKPRALPNDRFCEHRGLKRFRCDRAREDVDFHPRLPGLSGLPEQVLDDVVTVDVIHETQIRRMAQVM